jgi:hypothetical protein
VPRAIRSLVQLQPQGLVVRLHTTPKGVVHALVQQGILVDEELVRAVLVEMLKETTRVARFPGRWRCQQCGGRRDLWGGGDDVSKGKATVVFHKYAWLRQA